MGSTVFSLAPFAALIVCAIGGVLVCGRDANRVHVRTRPRWTVARCLPLIAFAMVGAEHLLLLAAPHAVLRWNADVRRLIALEAIGGVAGCACVAAALVALCRQLFGAAPADKSIARTLDLSIASVAMVSGVAIAIAYRWASSWSVVTLTPYVWSLSSAQPRVDLVASTPFLVRLHVLGAFASVALLPFGEAFAAFVAGVRWSVGATATLISRPRFTHAPLTVAAAGVRSKAVWSKEER